MSKTNKPKSKQKTKVIEKPAETEPEDEILPSDETTDEILDVEPDQEDEETEPEQIVDVVPEPETKTVPENTELTSKQKINALKRAVQNKIYSIDKEKTKVKDWRTQATARDEKATTEYEKRKAELEEMLKKSEERYQKRMKTTRVMWHEYSDNFANTKIKKLEDDLVLLQTELSKLEAKEPAETK